MIDPQLSVQGREYDIFPRLGVPVLGSPIITTVLFGGLHSSPANPWDPSIQIIRTSGPKAYIGLFGSLE